MTARRLDVVGALAGELDCGTGLEGVGPKLFDGAISVLVDLPGETRAAGDDEGSRHPDRG